MAKWCIFGPIFRTRSSSTLLKSLLSLLIHFGTLHRSPNLFGISRIWQSARDANREVNKYCPCRTRCPHNLPLDCNRRDAAVAAVMILPQQLQYTWNKLCVCVQHKDNECGLKIGLNHVLLAGCQLHDEGIITGIIFYRGIVYPIIFLWILLYFK